MNNIVNILKYTIWSNVNFVVLIWFSTMAEVVEQTFETFDTFEDAPLDEALESGDVAIDAEEEVITRAAAELPEIKLFGRWSCDDVNVKDMSLSVSY